MYANDLEKAVVERLLSDRTVDPIRRVVQWAAVKVRSRSRTGPGFMTEFEPSPELTAFAEDVSLRWGKAGARLGAERIETGYLVYVDQGQITAIEGYTYGEEWPTAIENVEWYENREGIELANPPKGNPA